MISWLEDYNKNGYAVIANYFTEKEIDSIYDDALTLREMALPITGWLGFGCASYFSKPLYDFYTCRKFYELSRQILGEEVYLFNDELVVKHPNDQFEFKPHYDNWFGPNKDNNVHTVNCYVVLDDITEDNGPVFILDNYLHPRKDIDETGFIRKPVSKLYKKYMFLKKGDVLAVRGDTFHGGDINTSNEIRAAYACVFTEKPLKEKIHYKNKPAHIPDYFYMDKFDKHSGEILNGETN